MQEVFQSLTCSVVIPTRRRAGILRETLESLCQQTEKEFEVIVVVDGEDPETRLLAESYKAAFPLRWIFEPEHRGQASARNTGAAAAESEIVVFLDDDTRPVEVWVHHHLKHHRANAGESQIGVLGKVADLHASPARSRTEQYVRELRNPVLTRFEDCLKSQSLEFGKVAAFGLNTSISRRLFFTVGGFDPKLSSLDEDTDLGARLYNHGVRFIFEREALVHHHETKNPLGQHYAILRSAGKLDVYRRREKKQCNGRLELLAQMHCGSPLRKLAHRTAWHIPQAFRIADLLARKTTDLTGSRRSFRIWRRATAAEYWKGLRAAGETIDSLRELYPSRTPILMLHSVSTPAELRLRSLYISPERFTRFMDWLKSSGYASVLPTDWYKRTSSTRRVILTFDDAYDDFMSNAFPVLARLRFSATVFVVVDRIGKTNEWDESRGFKTRRLLSLDQIRELHGLGVHFGSHTLTHARLTSASDRDLEREVADSKRKLEDLLGAEISCFAYPWGNADMRVRSAVVRAGYKTALTTEEGLNWSEDPLALKRTNLAEVDTLPEFAFKLATGRDLRQMTKAYLVKKGLYRRPEQPVRNKAGSQRRDEAQASQESAGVVAPRASGPGE